MPTTSIPDNYLYCLNRLQLYCTSYSYAVRSAITTTAELLFIQFIWFSNISFRASYVQKTVGLFQIQSINKFTWKQKRTQVPVSNTFFYSSCSPIRYSHAVYGARRVISVSQRGSCHVDWAGWMGVHWRNKSCTTAAISERPAKSGRNRNEYSLTRGLH